MSERRRSGLYITDAHYADRIIDTTLACHHQSGIESENLIARPTPYSSRVGIGLVLRMVSARPLNATRPGLIVARLPSRHRAEFFRQSVE